MTDPHRTSEARLDELIARLGVAISHDALRHALTHSTWAYENTGPNNERLEFLGDAVLGQSITAMLYRRFPDLAEGELAKRRATVVSTQALAAVAQAIDLGSFLLLGRGEEQTDGRKKPSLLADALEAVIGAVFLDCGSEAADELVARLIGPVVDDPTTFDAAADPKTALQEWLAARSLPPPRYVVTDDGPDHQKTFDASVYVDHPKYSPEPVGRGSGSSKKHAEIDAARASLQFLGR